LRSPSSLFAASVLGLAVVGLAGPRAFRGLASRWHEIHTPGSGRARVLAPDVLEVATALQRAGAGTFELTPSLASEAAIAPFVLEASWPARARTSAAHVVGYARELVPRSDCVVLHVGGRLALARCHL
jgi:hypothetical protein